MQFFLADVGRRDAFFAGFGHEFHVEILCALESFPENLTFGFSGQWAEVGLDGVNGVFGTGDRGDI
ncbi:MAG: hypothetical protein GY786_00650 [Proteobacteria bacterium]|nr:hypothetical protein [Pseudomonadota bacterium]